MQQKQRKFVDGTSVLTIFKTYKKADYSSGERKYINVCDGQIFDFNPEVQYNRESFHGLSLAGIKRNWTEVD